MSTISADLTGMEANSHKTCPKCNETKTLDSFYTDKRRNQPCAICKVCWKKKGDSWVEANPEKRQESHSKASRKQGIERYGISEDQYDEMIEAQDNLCAICHKPETKVMRSVIARLAIDHDHNSGRVRELLCSNCNSLLGMAGDSIEVLQQCIEYLQKHRT